MSDIDENSDNPFIRHREHLDVHRFAIESGLSDAAYVDMVVAADRSIIDVDGVGFRVTPLIELDLGRSGRALAKVETGSVGGSHKARHLFGLLLRQLIEEATPESERSEGPADLAIASCGNAALGAAVVARSAGRRLRVFVPTTADQAVLRELERLDADITTCPRSPGQTGDPCIAALGAALQAGARPFTVQGTVEPAAIDGGRTLGLELAEQLDQRGVQPAEILIQIGGGALATAVLDGLRRAWPDRQQPRFHPVQPEAAHPYVACWRRAVASLLGSRGLPEPAGDPERAELVARSFSEAEIRAHLEARPELMEPWPGTPHSVASGILDDVTYDWQTVMSHQMPSAGWPILVSEETFREAAEMARGVDPRPDETGAAGLAGLLTHRRAGATGDGESVVLLTGAVR